MAEQTPLFMDISNAYSGDELGLPYRDLIGEGIIAAGDLAVTAGAGNSVNVAAGACWVLGDTNPARQPRYRCYNDAVVNKGISPDPAQPRRVLVVAQIVDEAFSGTGRLWRIDAIHGTPAASPVVPATPASAVPLANILVPAAAASSAGYTFTDLRTRALVGGGDALGIGWTKLGEAAPAGAAVNFIDIPQTFQHLKIVWEGYQTAEGVLLAQLNGDTSAAYAYAQNEVLNGAANHSQSTGQTAMGVGVLGSAAGAYSGEIMIAYYRGGFTKRSLATYGGSATNRRVGVMTGEAPVSAAVTRVLLTNLANGLFTLYGGA